VFNKASLLNHDAKIMAENAWNDVGSMSRIGILRR